MKRNLTNFLLALAAVSSAGSTGVCPENNWGAEYSRPDQQPELQFMVNRHTNTNETFLIDHPDGRTLLIIKFHGLKYEYTASDNCNLIGNPEQGEIIIQLKSASANDAGIYRMKSIGSNDALQCLTLYILGVPEKPAITVSGASEQGGTVNLTCNSKSTTIPVNHSLTMMYNWFVKGEFNPEYQGRLQYSTLKDKISFSRVSKGDIKTGFKCIATETVTSGYNSQQSESAYINVLYGPDNTRLEPATSHVLVAEGEPFLPVSCIAECNPTCSFFWTKGEDLVSNGGILELGVANESQSATYSCYVTRTGGPTTNIQISILVAYKPKKPLWFVVKNIAKVGLVATWEKDPHTIDSKQFFRLEMRLKRTGNAVRTINVYPNNTSHVSTNKVYLLHLEDKEPGVYEVALFSLNKNFNKDPNPLKVTAELIIDDGNKTSGSRNTYVDLRVKAFCNFIASLITCYFSTSVY